MAKREAPSRRLAKPDGAAEKAPSRSNHMQNTQAPRKRQPLIRNDVIRCEKCGEDYSVTYKRCPFCDERPGRPGVIPCQLYMYFGAAPAWATPAATRCSWWALSSP